MKRKYFLIAILIFVVLFSACSKNEKIPDGTWKSNISGVTEGLEREFTVEGSRIIVTGVTYGIKLYPGSEWYNRRHLPKSVRVYTYKINGNEIILTTESDDTDEYEVGEKIIHTFKRNSENICYIGDATFSKE
jgi:hypothetical protein